MTRIRQIRLRALASLPPSNNVFRLTLSDGHTDDDRAMQLGFPRDIRCPVGFAVAEIDLKAGKFSKPRVLTASTLIRQSTSRSSKGFEIAQSRRQANGLHLLSKKPERFRSVARSDNTTPVFSRIIFVIQELQQPE